MSFAEACEYRHTWVYFRLTSGAVTQVRYHAPADEDRPKDGDGIGVLEADLSHKALRQVHQLVVQNGRVLVRGSLSRRR